MLNRCPVSPKKAHHEENYGDSAEKSRVPVKRENYKDAQSRGEESDSED